MRDLRDIDAPGGNVRGDQDVEGTLSKSLHGPVALVLRHVALKGDSAVTVLDQFLCQLPCSALGPSEDDGRFELVLAKQMAQHLDLTLFPDRIESVFNRAGGYRMVDLSDEGVDQHLLGQPTDLARHRCGEQQVLAACRQLRDDALDIGQETHVKHVICFIEDQGVDPRQIDKSTTEQIEQPSRASTDHIDLAGEFLDLWFLGDATVDGHRADAGVPTQFAKLLVDLGYQFASRADHQHSGTRPVVSKQVLDAGDRERCGFSGSSLGQPQHIPASEGCWNGSGLYRSWFRVVRLLDRFGEGGDQIQLVEIGDGIRICARQGDLLAFRILAGGGTGDHPHNSGRQRIAEWRDPLPESRPGVLLIAVGRIPHWF